MRITPFRVLEEHARAEYRRKFQNAPEPRVINARALVALDAPRSFIWGGVGYWCPSLSYEGGVHLLVTANAIRDLRKGGNTLRLEAARVQAARLIRRHVRAHRRPWWRLTRAFLVDPADQLEGLIHWLLHVEDQSAQVPSDRPVTVDLIHLRYAFEDVFGRPPRSWADYVYGIRYIGRRASQQDLRSAAAVRVGSHADKKGWADYEREMRAMGGLN